MPQGSGPQTGNHTAKTIGIANSLMRSLREEQSQKSSSCPSYTTSVQRVERWNDGIASPADYLADRMKKVHLTEQPEESISVRSDTSTRRTVHVMLSVLTSSLKRELEKANAIGGLRPVEANLINAELIATAVMLFREMDEVMLDKWKRNAHLNVHGVWCPFTPRFAQECAEAKGGMSDVEFSNKFALAMKHLMQPSLIGSKSGLETPVFSSKASKDLHLPAVSRYDKIIALRLVFENQMSRVKDVQDRRNLIDSVVTVIKLRK